MSKKSKQSLLLLLVFVFVLTVANSCDPTISVKLIPVLTTNETTLITQNTATSGGNISSDNGFEVTARGVCWSLKPSPTIKDSLTKDAVGIGAFTSSIKNLLADTTYYLKAYATNKNGTAYGLQKTFRTFPVLLPVITTIAVTNFTATTAISGGNITSNGGSAIIDRGVCWSTSPNPTITNNKTFDGSGTGVFSSNLTNLLDGIYYIRAYASNKAGTTYGNQLTFEVYPVYDVDGNGYHTVTIGTQTWLVENLKTTKYNDGTDIPIVADGKAWSNLTTPAYCFYNNDAVSYKSNYGALYNWYAVNTAKLAPKGWHIPTDDEWTTIVSFILANPGTSGSTAKALAATTDWASSIRAEAIGNDLTRNNSSGFSALPGGYRSDYSYGSFGSFGTDGYWWSATGDSFGGQAKFRSLFYDISYMMWSDFDMQFGFSVRCLRDY